MAPPKSPQDSAGKQGSAGTGGASGARAPCRTGQARSPGTGQEARRRLLSRAELAALRRKLREKFH